MEFILTALALYLVVEGIVYAAMPDAMKRMMAIMLELPAGQLRAMGLAMAATGVFFVWLIRG